MITIYHNPRCAKSREGLALLEASGKEHDVILYLQDVLTKGKLKKILEKLRYAPIDLIRKNESIWKEQFKGKHLTDEELIDAMIKFPKLIERPIIVGKTAAVVGRPAEKIKEVL